MSSDPTAVAPECDKHIPVSVPIPAANVEFFRYCLGRFPDPVIVADMASAVVFLNDCAQRITGCAVGDSGLLMCSDILRRDTDSTQNFLVEQCLEKKTIDSIEVRLKNHAGQWLSFFLSAQLVESADGKPIGCVAFLRDVPAVSSRSGGVSVRPSFSSVLNNFPMAFFSVDTNLTITYMNDDLERLTGYARDEVVNRMTCAELLRTDACHTEECSVRQSMTTRSSISGLRRVILDRENRQVPVSVHTTIITDSENNVIGGFQALRDISSIVEAEQKIRMLLEVTQEGILMMDESNRVMYANARMGEILDRTREELIGKDVSELLPFQLLNIMNDLVEKVDQDHPQLLRFCSTIQESERLQQEFRVFETCIVVSRAGKSLTTCMYFHDLTKHIEIERQLFDANSFLNNIIMSSADGIIVLDATGNVVIYNEAAERLFGYTAKEVIGVPRSLVKVLSPEKARENMRLMRNSPDGKLPSRRLNLVRKDGQEVPANFSAAIIKKEGREIGTVGIFSDLTERMRMRRELEEAKAQLMQAEKIASIGRLAAGVAHEINNPLSGILIFAEILAKDLAQNPRWSEDIQEIINQTLRCKEIVNRLLDFSRQSVGQRTQYDVNVIIKRSFELLARQALFHNVEFVTDFQPDIPQMTGDPGQLLQVFTNLILNAGTAMKGRGKITVISRFDRISENVILHFADTGPGIRPDQMAKIFEPFFTTKAPGEGTGLGLSVAYGIIQQHGGSIDAGMSSSGGALFTIVLPLQCPEKGIEFA